MSQSSTFKPHEPCSAVAASRSGDSSPAVPRLTLNLMKEFAVSALLIIGRLVSAPNDGSPLPKWASGLSGRQDLNLRPLGPQPADATAKSVPTRPQGSPRPRWRTIRNLWT